MKNSKAKAKILLINPPVPGLYNNYFGPPYGLALIGAVLREHGFAVSGLNLDYEPLESAPALAARIAREQQPLIIGITGMTSVRGGIYRLIPALRRASPGSKIVMGGPFATEFYDLLLRRKHVDFVVVGEGEDTIVELAGALAAGPVRAPLAGMAMMVNGKVVMGPARAPIANLDDSPFPAFDIFKGFEKRLASARVGAPAPMGLKYGQKLLPGCRMNFMRFMLNLETSRGCLFACKFCQMSKATGPRLRFHSPKYVVDMVEYFHKKHGIRDFEFLDNFFTASRSRVMEICRLIIKRGLKVRWELLTRCDAVDRELLQMMARAGCVEIFYGVESYSLKVQRTTGKNLDVKKVAPCLKETARVGIDALMMLMVGSPGEDESSVRETLTAVRHLQPAWGLVRRVSLYPGNVLHDAALKNGEIKLSYYETDEVDAPYYHGSNSEADLARFALMLQERHAYVRLLPPDKGKRSPDLLKRLVITAVSRADAVVLCGEDAASSPEFPVALEVCRELGFRQVEVFTSGAPFLDAGFRSMVRRSGVNIIPLLPFYSPDPRRHDELCKTPGSAERVQVAADICKREGWQCVAGLYIDECAEKLPAFTSYLVGNGFSRVDFVFGSGAEWPGLGVPLPKWSSVAAFVSVAAAKAGRNTRFWGVPECLLAGIAGAMCESWRPFDEEMLPGGPRALSLYRENTFKCKGPRCKKCAISGHCEGIWKSYYKSHGGKELEPVSKGFGS